MSLLPDASVGNHDPLYNIGVVARMTGVSMPTLRAWERRYSFPDSERTTGGHRLYSEHDVVRLRWVKDRIEEGMQTAQAINALRHQEQVGHLALVEYLPVAQSIYTEVSSAHILLYAGQLLQSLVAGDLIKADLILGDAVTISTPEDLILDMICPALAGIGEAWENGHISVATEHLATNHLRQRLLMWMISSPPPKMMNPIVLACAPDEWHEGSLLILGALLRRRRWPVAYLGQALPLSDLASFVHDFNPPLVVLVAMTENSAAQMAQWPQFLPQAIQTGKPLVAFGGRIFTQKPEWGLRMTGTYLGDTFREGLTNIERLLT